MLQNLFKPRLNYIPDDPNKINELFWQINV